MKPSDQLIEKVRKFYLEEFGEEISHEQAYERFMRLVTVLRIILQPLPEQSHDNAG